MATPETIINEIHRVHRSIAQYPAGYLASQGYSLLAMSNIYDPVHNPAGVGILAFCGLMDDYDITHSAETNDDLRACDNSANSTLTATSYEISGTTRRDKDLTAWSPNNALLAAFLKPDVKWELLDFYGARDSEAVLPENPFTDGVEWRLYEFDTDVWRDNIANSAMAAADVALISKGHIIQARAQIANANPVQLSYTEPEEFNSNENVDIWVGVPGALSNVDAPDINEVNDTTLFRNIVGVNYFDGSTFPSATASDSTSFPTVNQNASSQVRGTAQSQATLQVPLIKDIEDHITTQGWLYNLLDVKPNEEIVLPIVTRIAQAPATTRSDLNAGDLVSVFLFKARIAHRNSTGDNPYFIDSELAPAGTINVNVFAVDGSNLLPQTVDWTNLPTTIGGFGAIRSKVNGIDTSHGAKYTSSDISVARVDSTGFVTVVGAGTYTITSHIEGCADETSATITATAPTAIDTPVIPSLPIAGGVVTITATSGVDAVSGVTVDGIAVDEFAKISDTELAVVVPEHVAGTVDVVFDGHWTTGAVTETATYA